MGIIKTISKCRIEVIKLEACASIPGLGIPHPISLYWLTSAYSISKGPTIHNSTFGNLIMDIKYLISLYWLVPYLYPPLVWVPPLHLVHGPKLAFTAASDAFNQLICAEFSVVYTLKSSSYNNWA